MRTRTKIFLASMSGLFLTTLPGRADLINFDINAPGISISASGAFTTDPESGGSYQITSMTGELDGNPITLLPSGTYSGSDNFLFANAPYADFGGIAFSAGGEDYDLFEVSGGTLDLCVVAPGGCSTPGPPNAYAAEFDWSDTTTGASSVPEPPGLLLLGAALLGVVRGARGAFRGRSRRGAARLEDFAE